MQPNLLQRLGVDHAPNAFDATKMIEDRGARYLGGGQATDAFSFRVMPEQIYINPHLPYPARGWSMPSDFMPMIAQAEIRPQEVVVRVTRTTNDQGGLVAFRIAMKHQTDPWAPKIYELIERNDWWACVCEHLESLDGIPSYDAELWEVRPQEFIDGPMQRHDGKSWGKRAYRPSFRLLQQSTYIAELAQAREKHGLSLSWDLHGGNIMLRRNPRHMVMVDPLHGTI